MISTRRLRVTSIVLLGTWISAEAIGQTVSTQILGRVTDPAGAVIPGATITARRTATGDVRRTTTNETGNYTIPLLDVGDYEVTCALPGFKTETRRGVALELEQKLRLDFQLQIGQQADKVEVTAAAPLLLTEDATLGSVVDERRLLELPTNGRNFAQTATLQSGVVYGTTRMGVDGQQTMALRAMPGQIVGLSANGQRDLNQNITLDGVSAVDGFKNAMLFVPSIEVVEEFKVQSAVYSAEFGMNSGAQASVIIKSGTNQIHGTAFEFLRNNDLDARNFFLPAPHLKNTLHRNQFGGVVSGPIKRNKTFWLFNYEGRREVRGTANQYSVPTLAMRAGDFSELLQPGNRWYPTTNVANLAIRYPGSNVPFPNNIVPPSLINPVAQNLMTYKNTSPFPQGGFIPYPNYDSQARAIGSTQNLIGSDGQILNSDTYVGRIDHRFGDKDRIFGHYVIVQPAWTQDPLTQVSKVTTDFRTQNLAVGYTKILSATVLNEARFGYLRNRALSGEPQTNSNFNVADLGLDIRVVGDNNRALSKFEEGVPTISIAGFTGTGSGNVAYTLNELYNASDNLTISHGKHNFKVGAEYRDALVLTQQGNFPRGQLAFTRDLVSIPDAFAAFILGFPYNGSSSDGATPVYPRQEKLGLYWLDDFKATSKLTVNFGLRWDLYGEATDSSGKLRNLSFANKDLQIINGQEYPVLIPPTQKPADLYNINWKQFMPRLGIAYRFSDRMVLRMGSGHFYSPQQLNNFNILQGPQYSGYVIYQNTTANPLPVQDLLSGPGASSQAGPLALTMLGELQASQGNRPAYRNNDIWQWTAEVQRSFGKDLVAALTYVGSASAGIDMTVSNWNNPDPGLGTVQARRPLQYYIDTRQPGVLLPVSTIRRLESWVSANYNALQSRFEKRYSKGLTFNASFVYQRANSIGYGVNESGLYGSNFTQNPRNRKGDYGRSYIDQRFRFVMSHVWEIPWLRHAKGPKNWFLGGWAINGIVQLQSGLPVTVAQSGDSQNTGASSMERPNIVYGQKVDTVMDGRTLSKWFNTAAFVQSKCNGCPGNGTFIGPMGYGNAGVSLFDSPAQKTWDVGIFKEFKVKEGHTLQFRYEAFNFLNTPQFAAPDRTLGDAAFGRITTTLVNNREMQFGLKYRF